MKEIPRRATPAETALRAASNIDVQLHVKAEISFINAQEPYFGKTATNLLTRGENIIILNKLLQQKAFPKAPRGLKREINLLAKKVESKLDSINNTKGDAKDRHLTELMDGVLSPIVTLRGTDGVRHHALQAITDKYFSPKTQKVSIAAKMRECKQNFFLSVKNILQKKIRT